MLRIAIIIFAAFQATFSIPLNCVCGKEQASTRIVNGAPVQQASHPWMVALLLRLKGGLGLAHFCGGTIINNEWIMTAAHCTDNKTSGDVFVLKNTKDLEAIKSDKIIAVDKIWSHPKYVGIEDWFQNDISLLHLSTPLTFSNERLPICLPAKYMRNFHNLQNMGWGKTSSAGGQSMQLLYIDTYQTDVCYKIYEHFNFGRKQICSYSRGKGTCNGDSGGPLFTRKNGHVTQVGINSWITGDCGTNPYVATRVSEFVDDIKEVTRGSLWCRNPNLGNEEALKVIT